MDIDPNVENLEKDLDEEKSQEKEIKESDTELKNGDKNLQAADKSLLNPQTEHHESQPDNEPSVSTATDVATNTSESGKTSVPENISDKNDGAKPS